MLTLRPLATADLGAIEAWFDNAETRRWLGDKSWPAKGLRLAGPNRHELIGILDGGPVGLVDVEISRDGRAAFAIVIAPARRGQGIGRHMIETCIADPLFDKVEEWFAGVERGNVASQQLLERAGFLRMTDEDRDGFSYFARRRSGWPDLPWRPYELKRPSTAPRRRKLGAAAW